MYSGILFFLFRSIRRFRSIWAHWVRETPGWRPELLTGFGNFPVENRRCSLRPGIPRLTPSTATQSWREGLARRKGRRMRRKSSFDKIWQPSPGRWGTRIFTNDQIKFRMEELEKQTHSPFQGIGVRDNGQWYQLTPRVPKFITHKFCHSNLQRNLIFFFGFLPPTKSNPYSGVPAGSPSNLAEWCPRALLPPNGGGILTAKGHGRLQSSASCFHRCE